MGWAEDSQRDNELKHTYWVGYDGKRQYRKNVWKWLNGTTMKAWGWAEYKKKTIHVWIHPDCDMAEAIACIAHEAAHFRRPRYKDKQLEEKKAAKTELDARFAYEAAKGFLIDR